jgi:hypothetical protein
MKGPGNAQHRRGPSALVRVGAFSAREPLHYGGISNLHPISLGPADLFFAELPPNLRGLRLSHFSFPEVHSDHVAHLSLSSIVNSVTRNPECDMDGLTWLRKDLTTEQDQFAMVQNQ